MEIYSLYFLLKFNPMIFRRFIYFSWKSYKERERQGDLLHLLTQSPNSCHSWSWAGTNWRARGFFWISFRGAGAQDSQIRRGAATTGTSGVPTSQMWISLRAHHTGSNDSILKETRCSCMIPRMLIFLTKIKCIAFRHKPLCLHSLSLCLGAWTSLCLVPTHCRLLSVKSLINVILYTPGFACIFLQSPLLWTPMAGVEY